MIRDFFRHSAIYGIGKVIALALGFLTIPIITKTLSPADYGVFDFLNLCLILLNLSVAMEISQAVARFIIDTPDKIEKKSFVSTAYFFSMGMYTLCAIALYGFREQLSQFIFHGTQYVSAILYLIPWLYLHGTNTFISNQFRWENKPKIQAILQMTMSVSLLGFVVYFLKYQMPSLENLIYAYLFSQTVTFIIGAVFIIRYEIMNWSFSMPKLKMMLLFSSPLVPSSIAVFAQNYIDRIMISQMIDVKALGIYALAFKIASMLTLISSIFQLSIVPLIYKHYRNETASRDFAKVANVYLFFMLMCILGISIFVPELFQYFIGHKFASAASMIPWLLFAIGFQSFYSFAPGLAIAKKTHYIAYLNIIGMGINFILNYVFIIRYGLIGAAYATLFSAIIICVVNIIISQKHYFIHFEYYKMIGAFLIITIPLSIFYSIGNTISGIVFSMKLLAIFFTTGILIVFLFQKNMREFLKNFS